KLSKSASSSLGMVAAFLAARLAAAAFLAAGVRLLAAFLAEAVFLAGPLLLVAAVFLVDDDFLAVLCFDVLPAAVASASPGIARSRRAMRRTSRARAFGTDSGIRLRGPVLSPASGSPV